MKIDFTLKRAVGLLFTLAYVEYQFFWHQSVETIPIPFIVENKHLANPSEPSR